MKIFVEKKQIYERKADKSGRVSLPGSKFAGKQLEIIVFEKRKNHEVLNRVEEE